MTGKFNDFPIQVKIANFVFADRKFAVLFIKIEICLQLSEFLLGGCALRFLVEETEIKMVAGFLLRWQSGLYCSHWEWLSEVMKSF